VRTAERSFKRFVGVDLGGGKGKKTALAAIELRANQPNVVELAPRAGAAPLYDALLVERLRASGEETLLAVDAPLTLPPCLRCVVPVCPGQERCDDPSVRQMRTLTVVQDETRDARRGKPSVTPYTQRATEVYLHRVRGLAPRETLGQGMGPLTARAVHLVRALAGRFTLEENLIEVYPRATLELLGVREAYKKRVDTRLHILAQLEDLAFAPGVWREDCVQSDHVFDALICAYTAYLFWRDGWQRPADVAGLPASEGWVWVPPARIAPPLEEGLRREPDELAPRRRSSY
jgi:predicted nuclease with RNAse H fold